MKAALALAALFVLAGCAPAVEERPYVFGAVLPLTGGIAFYGTFSQRGIDLAIEDINKAGGINGRPATVIYEDSANDKQKAATVTQKLINIDDVDALLTITPFMGGVVAPIAEENKIPFIHVGSVNAFVLNKTYAFKDYPDVADICELLMRQAKKDGHEKVAFFGIQAESTEFCKRGAEHIGQFAAFETYAQGEVDYATQFTKIKKSGSTALLLYTLANDCPNAYKYVREQGLAAQLYLVIQSFTCGTPTHTQANADLLTNAYGSDVALDEGSPEYVAFKERIEAAGGSPHLVGSAMMYDITREMAIAYEGCQDKLCVTNNLRNLDDYHGISGRISFKGQQISQRDVMLVKHENGAWIRAG